eukprot:1190000-Prorocentrum_minimum.AAC.1
MVYTTYPQGVFSRAFGATHAAEQAPTNRARLKGRLPTHPGGCVALARIDTSTCPPAAARFGHVRSRDLRVWHLHMNVHARAQTFGARRG